MSSRKLTGLVLCTLAALLIAAAIVSAQPKAPVAKVEPKVDTMFGHVMVDNYFWLRNRGSDDVLNYLKEENAYTESMLSGTDSLQQALYDEMRGRIKETDLSVPTRYMDYYYYSRTEEGKQYQVFCRRQGSMDAPEEIILDENALAEGHDFYSVGAFEISPMQDLLAYSYDTTGGEVYTLVVKNLMTGEYFSDSIANVSSAVWAADNKTLFYTTEDEARRPFKLWRHELGGDPAFDAMVYHETDDAFYLGITESRSRAYLFMVMGSQVTSEVRYLKSDDPTGEFKTIAPRKQDVQYQAEHHDDEFYILTNENAKNFKLMVAPVSDPSEANWKEVIPERKDVMIESVDAFKDFMVVYERKDALMQVRVRDLTGGADYYIEWDEPVYTAYGGRNPNYDATVLRLGYQSLITPSTVYDFNMKTREKTMLKQSEVLGGYDPTQYQEERLWATASDGTRIPMALVYKKGMKRDGSNPAYMYGYGAYGYTMDPWFSSNRLSLLDRGFVWVLAQIRGGGAMGRYWYEDGKLLNKQNTFTDFIACGDYLVEQGYTSHDKLAISGGSAGGLLVGAVVNMRPDLAKVAIADVPFVDLMNTMLDASLPLTVVEYEEWGNPNDSVYFDYMMSYSPYDNVRAQNYPDMLITAGLNDPRVQYWEPAKWTAKLRATETGNNLILLKTNMGAGHMGASGRFDYLKDVALEDAFIFWCFGMVK